MSKNVCFIKQIYGNFKGFPFYSIFFALYHFFFFFFFHSFPFIPFFSLYCIFSSVIFSFPSFLSFSFLFPTIIFSSLLSSTCHYSKCLMSIYPLLSSWSSSLMLNTHWRVFTPVLKHFSKSVVWMTSILLNQAKISRFHCWRAVPKPSR